MSDNAVIAALLNRRSIRRYADELPSDEVVEKIVRAGRQATCPPGLIEQLEACGFCVEGPAQEEAEQA